MSRQSGGADKTYKLKLEVIMNNRMTQRCIRSLSPVFLFLLMLGCKGSNPIIEEEIIIVPQEVMVLGARINSNINKLETAETDVRVYVDLSIDAANKSGLFKVLVFHGTEEIEIIADDELKIGYKTTFNKVFDVTKGDSWKVEVERHMGNPFWPDHEVFFRSISYEIVTN